MTGGPNKVLFDMGGVFFAYNPARRLTYISEMCGIIESEVQASVFDTQFDEECELGAFSAAESLAEFNRLCGTETSYDDFQAASLSAFEPNRTVFGIAKELARSLSDKNNIITNYNMLPGDKDAKNPTGLRIGVQEMTRYGMKEDEMGELADLMKAGLQGKIVKDEVIKLRSRFTDVHFA